MSCTNNQSSTCSARSIGQLSMLGILPRDKSSVGNGLPTTVSSSSRVNRSSGTSTEPDRCPVYINNNKLLISNEGTIYRILHKYMLRH